MYEFVFESRVAVDSGQLSIADPCYWSNDELSQENLSKLNEENTDNQIIELGVLNHVQATMATVFSTTRGDGIFDVYSVWKNKEIQGMFVSFMTELIESENE
jgi:hypothetical protein